MPRACPRAAAGIAQVHARAGFLVRQLIAAQAWVGNSEAETAPARRLPPSGGQPADVRVAGCRDAGLVVWSETYLSACLRAAVRSRGNWTRLTAAGGGARIRN